MPEASGVGNGVHIHMSLQDASGAPVTYAATGPMGLSMAAQHFCAGVLAHLPAICAITAPSPVSYLRLTPNRWAPTLIDIVQQDRGAALRVCPVFAASDPDGHGAAVQLEFRVCDAAASPYLALGAVIFAGADGLQRKLGLPPSADGVDDRCRLRSARRWTAWRQARRWPAGSARCFWRPICGTSDPRCTTWPNGR